MPPFLCGDAGLLVNSVTGTHRSTRSSHFTGDAGRPDHSPLERLEEVPATFRRRAIEIGSIAISFSRACTPGITGARDSAACES